MDLNSLKEEKKKQILSDFKIIDLNSNDEQLLDNLASAMVLLEQHERQISKLLEILNEDPANGNIILALQRLNESASKLRNDISKFQNDLGITRRQRSSKEGEEDIYSLIQKVRKAAKIYAEYKTVLVFCDECNILIGQVWWKSGKKEGNGAQFVCPKCNKQINVLSKNVKKDFYPNYYNRVPAYL